MKFNVYSLLIGVPIGFIFPFRLFSYQKMYSDPFPKMHNDIYDNNWYEEYYARMCSYGEIVKKKELKLGRHGGGKGDFPGVRLKRKTKVKRNKVTGQKEYERFIYYDYKLNGSKINNKYKRNSYKSKRRGDRFTCFKRSDNKGKFKEKVKEKDLDIFCDKSKTLFLSDTINLYLFENLYLVRGEKSMFKDISTFIPEIFVFPEITNILEEINIEPKEKSNNSRKNTIYVQLLLDEEGLIRRTFLRNRVTLKFDSLTLETVNSLDFLPARFSGKPVKANLFIKLVLSAEEFYETKNCKFPY